MGCWEPELAWWMKSWYLLNGEREECGEAGRGVSGLRLCSRDWCEQDLLFLIHPSFSLGEQIWLDMHRADMALSPPRKTNGDKDLE